MKLTAVGSSMVMGCLALASACGPGSAPPPSAPPPAAPATPNEPSSAPPVAKIAARAALPTPPARIEVQGHRGARAVLPEETLEAFSRAIEVGADTLELDLSMTKDGHLVVLHDLSINGDLCLGPDGERLKTHPTVRSLTLAEIKQFDCGTLKNPRFPKQTPVPGARIATFHEVFELARNSPLPGAKTVRFNVEMKSIPARPELTPPPDELARAVLDEIDQSGMKGRVIIQSFDHRMLAAIKRIAPEVPISLLEGPTLPDLVAMAEHAGAEVVSPNVDWITADEVRALHAKGIRVVPWTANNEKQWSYLVEIGVDGIISDDPGALIAWLREKKLR